MSDHNKITFAIKYLPMSHLRDDVISHVTISELGFFAAVTRFHYWVKVARHSFSESIPSTFEHKLRRHKQSFRKIATTVVLDEDENLL